MTYYTPHLDKKEIFSIIDTLQSSVAAFCNYLLGCFFSLAVFYEQKHDEEYIFLALRVVQGIPRKNSNNGLRNRNASHATFCGG